MKIEFDTRYLTLLNGNLKAAWMLAIAVHQQIEFNKENEPDKFGHNFWPMGIKEWQKLGLGTNKPQKNMKAVLNQYDFYRERIWGRYRRPGKYKEGRSCPPRMEYFVDLELLEKTLNTISARDAKM